ncbi:MAG: hypothetical protein J5819_01560 [Eubacterium sp.]|nr:hypothetical protein [Eubacterium sp.]
MTATADKNDTAPVTWDEMVEKYPNSWVVIRNAEMDGPNIISGIVETVKTDDEICDYESQHLREGLVFMRTTEGDWSGTIDSNLRIEIE